MVGTLHSLVAHTDTVQLTVIIRVEVLMDFVIDIIVNTSTLRVWYTFPTTVEIPRFAETALFAFPR